jgi:hypothetical protein
MSRASDETAARRAVFRQAHAEGMKAIEDADLPGLLDALRREHEVIGAQAELIEDAKRVVGLPPRPQRLRKRNPK